MEQTHTSSLTGLPTDRLAVSNHLANFVEQVKKDPLGRAHILAPLLSEQHPIYKDQSTKEMARMRGYVMAAMELTGVPDRALPYILESLESEFHSYLVAAAARSLRGLDRPHPQIAPYLIKAVYNIWEIDNPVSFESYRVKWPQEKFQTALTEIFETLAYLGSFAQNVLADLERLNHFYGDKFNEAARSKLIEAISAIKEDERKVDTECCQSHLVFRQGDESDEHATPDDIPGSLVVHDQDGTQMFWNELVSQKPTILAFFYTRCNNPRKCTQTILNLAAIRRKLAEAGLDRKIRVLAVSYDPDFDTPEALKSYGNARKFVFDDDSRMLRVPDEFDAVVRAFKLGVNFTGSQVNSHRIELFLLDNNGEIVRSFLRVQSEPQHVVDAVSTLLCDTPPADPKSGQGKRWKDRFHVVSSFLLGCLMVFFPKCPMCWVTYMSLFGIAGAETIPYSPWLLPVIIFMLLTNLYFLFRGAPSRNGYLPFMLSVLGSIFLIVATTQSGITWSNYLGLGLLLSGALLQSLSYSKFNKLRLQFRELQFRLTRIFSTPYVTQIVEIENQCTQSRNSSSAD